MPASIDHALDFIREQNLGTDGLTKSRLDPHFLYMFFNSKGQAEYIGVASAIKRRLADHKRDSEWWSPDLKSVYLELPSRRAALNAEKQMIGAMRPKHNKMHNA